MIWETEENTSELIILNNKLSRLRKRKYKKADTPRKTKTLKSVDQKDEEAVPH